jgi:hypothetical protein
MFKKMIFILFYNVDAKYNFGKNINRVYVYTINFEYIECQSGLYYIQIYIMNLDMLLSKLGL